MSRRPEVPIYAYQLVAGMWTPKGMVTKVQTCDFDESRIQYWLSAHDKPEPAIFKNSTIWIVTDPTVYRTYDEMRESFWDLCEGE
jgi:hypothetical protein